VAALFASGRVVDLILGLTLLEGLALALLHRRTGRGVAPADLVPNLLAGACLLLAVRGALTGAWWGWVALPWRRPAGAPRRPSASAGGA
jgi:hypothetical protein